ncbi:ParB/Srx family N-terminal domain-containing protein [Methylosinus sp. PW1]|uniref:ParB/Srx family N-terminal domain-containing protein n=1 Tax=Methylosinus sp. PW1 TaxID=107636 RepID=UPI00068AB1DE|nr:ParB/Srx family N-terminal domain-containing protein [Methylosinus sp. PW1]
MSDKSDIRLQVVYRPIDELIPYSRNSRTHSPAQLRKLAEAIKRYGFTNPVLLDGKNGILAGHGRTAAAKEAGLNKVPTIDLGHLSNEEQRAYIIADNKLSDESSWNDDMLALELSELKSLDFDLSLTGFDDQEIKSLLEPEPPKAEEPKPTPGAPVSQPGDVWVMGSHRLEVGESDHAVADAICGLWHSHLDSPAVLEATGQTFAEVMTERNPSAPVVPKLTRAKARDALAKAGKPRAKKDDAPKGGTYH